MRKNNGFRLSASHIAAVRRPRRLVVNHQVDGLLKAVDAGMSLGEIVAYEFAFADEPNSHIDAQWWPLDNTFPLNGWDLIDASSPSVPEYISAARVKTFSRWAAADIDIARVYTRETKKRGLECFYSYRLNETPYTEFDALARAQPEWLLKGEWDQPIWDFTLAPVRDLKIGVLQTLARDYDFDGIEIDFARGTILAAPGQQWAQCAHISDFLRQVRRATLDVAERRGRPFLLAARVPDNLPGCRFDGLDIDQWIAENLVDILVLGVRSLELKIEQFRHLVDTKPIQIFATLDDHHCSDGYSWPPIEVWRGLAASWWQQGVDAIQTFNWGVAPPALAARFGLRFRGAYEEGGRQIPLYQQAYHELGAPQKLRYLDKHFVVQRRGGGGSGGAPVELWTTPRFNYQNTNMLAQLPLALDSTGAADALIRLRVGDDLEAQAPRLEKLTLRLLLSDPAAQHLPAAQKVEPVSINPFWDRDQLYTAPPCRNLAGQLEVRLNNILLSACIIEAGWFVFAVDPLVPAVGENLVGLRLPGRNPHAAPATVEKIELHANYR